jgi:hypothetical protein
MKQVPRGWLIATAISFFLPGCLHGQNPCLERSVAVNVTSRDGSQVTDLAAADFCAEIGGVPAEIVGASFDTSARRLLILLDASGSMTSELSRWRTAVVFAGDVAEAAPKSIALGLTIFPVRWVPGAVLAEGREAVLGALIQLGPTRWDRVQGWRKTPLLDVIAESKAHFNPPRVGDSILLITDGEDNGSKSTADQIMTGLLASGTRVFGARLLSELPEHSRVQAGLALVSRLVGRTGGGSILLLPGERPAEEIGRMLDQMARFYQLQVRSRKPMEGTRPWRLRIQARRRMGENLRVTSPTQLAPCSL